MSWDKSVRTSSASVLSPEFGVHCQPSAPLDRVSEEPGAHRTGWFPNVSTRRGVPRSARCGGLRTDPRTGSTPGGPIVARKHQHLLPDIPVPITRAAALRRLRAFHLAGFTADDLADVTGLSIDELRGVVKEVPRGEKLTNRIIAAIAPLPFHPLLDDRPIVPAVGVVRRLRALVARGIPLSDIAFDMACTVGEVDDLIGWSDPTTVATSPLPRVLWFSAVAVYDGSAMRLTNLRDDVRIAAVDRGWAVPLAWDDQDIDDPHENCRTPADYTIGADTSAVQRRLDGDRTVELSQADKTLLVRMSIERGWSDERLADLLGDSRSTATRRRTRMVHRDRTAAA